MIRSVVSSAKGASRRCSYNSLLSSSSPSLVQQQVQVHLPVVSGANHSIISTRNFHLTSPSYSSGSGFFSNMFGGGGETKPEQQQQQSQAPKTTKSNDQFAKQIEKMGSFNKFTLVEFSSEINDALGTGEWKAKVPGLRSMDAVKKAQELKQVLNAIESELGKEATTDDLKNLTRKQKLKMSLKGLVEVSDLNQVIGQFQTMELMWKVLQFRKNNNLPLPSDEDEMKAILQKNLKEILSKKERKEMQQSQMKAMASRSRRLR